MYENEVTLYTDIFKLYQLYVYSPYRKYYPNRSLQIEIPLMRCINVTFVLHLVDQFRHCDYMIFPLCEDHNIERS